jgi:hypothetical protein
MDAGRAAMRRSDAPGGKKIVVSQLLAIILVLSFLVTVPAWAHVGSKDVFEQVDAGPYRLLVTVRTPNVIPGVATIEVRTSGPEVKSIRVTPLPLVGEAAKHPPTPDGMKASAADPRFFTGSLWLMASGSWQVRFEVEGAAGTATAGVPVAAAPLTTLGMQRPLGIVLGVLGLILAIGLAGIVAAAVREARLAAGEVAAPARRRRAVIAGVGALAVAGLMIYFGGLWWKAEAAGYAKGVYRPLELRTALAGNTLDLKIGASEDRRRWRTGAKDELLPDHGHLMHLYAIRWPEMDAVFHLHPTLAGEKHLQMTLPAMPAGEYRLYADIVHGTGFPETLTASLTVPQGMAAAPLGVDDASARPPAVSQGELGTSYKLPDGYSIVWDRPAEITANTAHLFRFHLLGLDGRPAADTQPYLGMAGHAAFVKTDGTVFAHTHPDGSAAMPAMMMANGGAMEEMPGMEMPMEPVQPVVEFPYGFPSGGRYRVFIQMKHGGVVETGVFDADVR